MVAVTVDVASAIIVDGLRLIISFVNLHDQFATMKYALLKISADRFAVVENAERFTWNNKLLEQNWINNQASNLNDFTSIVVVSAEFCLHNEDRCDTILICNKNLV